MAGPCSCRTAPPVIPGASCGIGSSAPIWHPGDHRPLPDIVASGRKPDVFACGYCHRADGPGGPENSDLAGLPKSYIIQQMADYKRGARGTAVSGRTPPTLMIALSKPITDPEVEAAATYFSALQPRKRIKVVESDTAPKAYVAGLLWAAAEGGEKVWTIPADRMKSKRPHRVPLSEQALAILKALPREEGDEFVFIGSKAGKSVSSASVLNYLQKLRDDATVHGMRSSFRDWAFERTNFPREVAEVALAHVVGDATERAYRRGDVLDKRRTLMAAWAKFVITKPVATSNNVVAIRA